MRTYMIGYDLYRPGQNYDDLFEAIKSVANGWWHCLDSTWIVKSSLTPVQIRERLKPHLDSNDELLVALIGSPAAWTGFDKNCSDWLSNNLK